MTLLFQVRLVGAEWSVFVRDAFDSAQFVPWLLVRMLKLSKKKALISVTQCESFGLKKEVVWRKSESPRLSVVNLFQVLSVPVVLSRFPQRVSVVVSLCRNFNLRMEVVWRKLGSVRFWNVSLFQVLFAHAVWNRFPKSVSPVVSLCPNFDLRMEVV